MRTALGAVVAVLIVAAAGCGNDNADKARDLTTTCPTSAWC